MAEKLFVPAVLLRFSISTFKEMELSVEAVHKAIDVALTIGLFHK